MRKTLLAAIMAASALIPAAAMAQDDHPRGEGRGRGDGQARPERQPPQQQAQPQPQARPQQAQPQREQRAPQAQVQVQAQAPAPAIVQGREGRGAWRGGAVPQGQARGDVRGGRGQYQPPVAQQQPQAQPPVQQQPTRGFNGGQRDGRPAYDQRGGRPDNGRPDYNNGQRGYQQGDRGYRGGDGGYNRGYQGNPAQNWNRDWRRDNRYNYNYYRNQDRNAYRLPRYYAPSGWGYGYRRFSIGLTLSSILFDQDYWIDDPYDYHLPPAYGPYRWVRYYNDALLVDIRSGYVVDTVYDIFW